MYYFENYIERDREKDRRENEILIWEFFSLFVGFKMLLIDINLKRINFFYQ